MNTTGWLL